MRDTCNLLLKEFPGMLLEIRCKKLQYSQDPDHDIKNMLRRMYS